ncbi:MAG: 3-phosphoshikimate 1-carboxyvinyltransferase [Chloroflexi bacterium]|nr:3-phosphoshikimate 1-carboxyvinyltransferase [Chloroflexota bacterium]
MSRRLHSASPLRGSIVVPGDKSISHRALLCNALAPGQARIDGFLPSEDCLRTMDCLRAYGVGFDYDPASPTTVVVRSPGRDAFTAPDRVLDCGNSGTSMRLLAGLAAGLDLPTTLDGDESLRSRPMDRVLQPLAAMGATVKGRDGDHLAPLHIRGGRLTPFRGALQVASAQVKSAIILAALAADGPSSIEEIAPTRDHTEILLRAMGARLQRTPLDGGRSRIEIEPGAPLHPIDLTVPGDISAAAFWLVAGSIVPDSEIRLLGVGVNPTRAGVIDILTAMGADITSDHLRTVGGEPVADLLVRATDLHATTIDGDLVTRAIDELPVLAVAAAVAQGRTEVRDAAELRVKESDRVASTVAMLRALGVAADARDDGFTIDGGAPLQGARMESRGDHRLAMAAAVAACVAGGPSEVVGDESVIVSYPHFWRDLDVLTQAPTQTAQALA